MNGSADTFGKNSPDGGERDPIPNDSDGKLRKPEHFFTGVIAALKRIFGNRDDVAPMTESTITQPPIDDPHGFGIFLSNPTDHKSELSEDHESDSKKFDPDLPADEHDAPHGEQEE